MILYCDIVKTCGYFLQITCRCLDYIARWKFHQKRVAVLLLLQ